MPCNIATDELTASFRKVPAVKTNLGFHRACSLRMKSGIVHPRVLCCEDSRGFHTDWWISRNPWISPDDIAVVESSSSAIPAHIAQKIYDAGESGMGYQIYALKFRGGSTQVFVTPNVLDFPDLPEGYAGRDIADAFPHKGRDNAQSGRHRGSADFLFCFYVPLSEKKEL